MGSPRGSNTPFVADDDSSIQPSIIQDYMPFGLGDTMVGRWLNGIFNDLLGNTKAQFEFDTSKYFTDRAEDYDMKKLQMQMDYNSEASKIKRMMEAGLNPALFSQSGSSMSTGSGVQGVPTSGPDPRIMLDSFTALNQRRLMMSQSRANDAKANLDNVEAGLRPLESDVQRNLWNAQINRYAKQNDLDDASARLLNDQAEFLEVTSQDQHDQIKETVNQLRSLISLYDAQKKTEEQKKVNLEHETAVIDATKRNLDASTELMREEADLVDEQERTQHEYTQIASHQVEYETLLGNLPCSVDFRDRISYLLSSESDSDHQLAQKLIDGYLEAETSIYNKTVENQWSNYGKEFWMGLGNAVPNLIPNFNVVATPGFGKRGRGSRR